MIRVASWLFQLSLCLSLATRRSLLLSEYGHYIDSILIIISIASYCLAVTLYNNYSDKSYLFRTLYSRVTIRRFAVIFIKFLKCCKKRLLYLKKKKKKIMHNNIYTWLGKTAIFSYGQFQTSYIRTNKWLQYEPLQFPCV